MYVFKSRPIRVLAVMLVVITRVETISGVMMGLPGDWLVVDKYGNHNVCSDATFRELYEPFDDDADRYFDRVKPTIH